MTTAVKAVKDVMTTRVVFLRKDASFKEMAAALREHRVSAFPVIDDEGTAVGVVSEADMLAKEVTLEGEPETNEVGHDIVHRIRHVPGVVAVRDRLSYPPPARRGDYDVLAHLPTD